MSSDQKGAELLARDYFKDLCSRGYDAGQIIGVATELIDLVTDNLNDGAGARQLEAPDLTPNPSPPGSPMMLRPQPPAV